MKIELNKIYNGDCLDLIKELPDECVDAVITDPPYSNSFTHNGNASTTDDLNICKPFFRELLKEIKRVLKPNGVVYWFCDWRSYPFYHYLFSEILPPKNMLVWDKINGPGSYYNFSHELIVFAAKGNFCFGANAVFKEAAFCSGAKVSDGEKVHPTQKPIKVISKLILDSTKEGALILDCFAGSCTTAVSAIINKRNFIMFELQEKYCEIGQKRIDDIGLSLPFEIKEIEKTKLF